jgi:hypothetical protein
VGPRAGLDAVANKKEISDPAGNRTPVVQPRSLLTVKTEPSRLAGVLEGLF